MIPAAAAIALAVTVVFCAVPELLLSAFAASDEMMELGIPALRIISVTFVFASVTMILGYSMSGLGNGMVNMLGTALRQLVLLVPLIYLLGRLKGIHFVWFAFWISELAAMAYAAAATKKILRQKKIIKGR